MHSLSHARCNVLACQQHQQLLRPLISCDIIHRHKQASGHAISTSAVRHSDIQPAAVHKHAAAAVAPGAHSSFHHRRRCAAAAAAASDEQQLESSSTAQPSPGHSSTNGTTQSGTPSPSSSSSSSSSSSDTQVQRQPPMQVTRHNFHYALPVLQEALASAQFYAFDCEMSGLYPTGMEDYTVDDVDDRYLKTAAAAESFLVTQMGLSLFTWTGSHYEARSFNFHLFPSPREEWDLRFSCQASSLAFLAAHGFDFNKMIYDGISFLPLSLRDKQMKAEADAKKAAATPPNLDDLDDDERCLLQELQETISNWLAQQPPPAAAAAAAVPAAAAAAAAADILHLPAPYPQLMKLQRRLLAAGIGTSRWSSSSSSSSGGGWQYIVELTEGSSTDIVLRRATAAEVKAAAAESQQRQQLLANRAAGFSQVLEMLRDSGVPAVGHNLRFDVAFVLAAFVQNPLPKTWSGFRELVGEWFPGGLYDTKYLARSLVGLGMPGSSALLPDTGLEPLFKPFALSTCAQQPIGSLSFTSTAGDSAPHAHTVNSATLSEWLQERTSALDDPRLWTTLPPVHHAHGCEQYAAVAAAVVGLQQQQQQQQQQQGGQEAAAAGAAAGGGGAHEAGFDAFMTGVAFLGLLRLYEITALSSMSRWLLPSAPSQPPQLSVVAEYAGRQYYARTKDIPYAALSGEEVVPQRPHVVFVTGFKSGRMRWQDIQAKFSRLGLGKPMVSLVREGANGTYTAVKGAYVMLQSPKEAAKAIQGLRSDKTLTAMTYADYLKSKGYATRSSSSSNRPLPQTIAWDRTADPNSSSSSSITAAAAVPAAAESLKVVQDLREAVAAKKQAQQAKATQQQQQQQQHAEATAADSNGAQQPSPAAAAAASQEQDSQASSEAQPSSSNSSSSSSSEAIGGSSSSSSSSGDGSSSAQQRLSALQQLSRPSRPGPALQRPAVRPTAFPPSSGGPASARQ